MTFSKKMKPKDWARFIHPGDRIFIGSNAACPLALVENLLEQINAYKDIEFVHILTLGESPWTDPKYQSLFRINSLFLGTETRKAVKGGFADYTPCFLSEIPELFTGGSLPVDVALIQVSPPDQQGYCSLGVSVDVVLAACRSARFVLAQVNAAMPVTYGQSFLHIDDIAGGIEVDIPLPELPIHALDKISTRIGKYAAMLIEDGATLQMGIGKIPDAVLKALGKHQDLGIHTEMFSDGILDLVEKGVVNNKRKTFHPGQIITSFCIGSRRLYDFVHRNPHVAFHPSDYVNSPLNIARNDNMVAINSAIEVDLTGQVVADSLGFKFYSGIGGQVDFIRGASMSRGGTPIIALPATAKGGKVSRIVSALTKGSGVVTSRGDVHYVVTEFGIATLRGKSIRERALEMIQVAHPDHRDHLFQEAQQSELIPSYQKATSPPVADLGDVVITKLKLKDGKYFLRPLRSSDEGRLQEFFYSHGQETLRTRYQYTPARMSREDAYSLVNVDQNRDLALCIVSRQGPREIIQAVGRYYLNEKQQTGEVAFVVRENKRRLGMASRLLKSCISVAKKRGLKQLEGVVVAGNTSMLHLGRKFDFKPQPGDDPREILIRLELT